MLSKTISNQNTPWLLTEEFLSPSLSSQLPWALIPVRGKWGFLRGCWAGFQHEGKTKHGHNRGKLQALRYFPLQPAFWIWAPSAPGRAVGAQPGLGGGRVSFHARMPLGVTAGIGTGWHFPSGAIKCHIPLVQSVSPHQHWYSPVYSISSTDAPTWQGQTWSTRSSQPPGISPRGDYSSIFFLL